MPPPLPIPTPLPLPPLPSPPLPSPYLFSAPPLPSLPRTTPLPRPLHRQSTPMATPHEASVDHHNEQQQQQVSQVEWFKYSKRVVLRSILGREDKGLGLVGKRVVVGGWVKSRRERAEGGASSAAGVQEVSCYEVLLSRVPLLRTFARALAGKNGAHGGRQAAEQANKAGPVVAYLRISDGSSPANFQVVVGSSISLVGQVIAVGTSVLVEGVLQRKLGPGKHDVELNVEKILYVGVIDQKNYPLAKKRLSLDFLRDHPHLRPRTTMVASISRIRSALSYATHKFFHNNGFMHVHMPIITTTDARNECKMFQVTTLFSEKGAKEKITSTSDFEAINIDVVRAAIKDKRSRIEDLKRTDSNKDALFAAEQDLYRANELARLMEKLEKSTSLKAGELNFSNDFFSRPAYLSFSARLHLETYACGLSSVYSFSPMFQADDDSKKCLAEMWMVEAELAFAELEDAMNCAEDLVKFLCNSLTQNCEDDIKYMSKHTDKDYLTCLESISSNPFARITYSESLNIINEVKDNKHFETKAEWGTALSKEHESFLADEVYRRPVIIYEYPKEVKPFYVRLRDDEKTASAFDIIVPKVGALVRGSQKEERVDIISKRIQELGLSQEEYGWYRDLRKHGPVKHSGFSLGFENMVMFATGLKDIRDTVPFPRTRGHAET